MTSESPAQPAKRRRLDRVTAACDLCKRRKVKCDGKQPCAYCTRKSRATTCSFTTSHIREQARSAAQTPNYFDNTRPEGVARRPQSHDGVIETENSLSPTISRDDHHEDTVVPLEGRILRDAQGKLIFIGDCAPLSFLQTVRYLITSEVDPEGDSVHAARDSIIEVARPGSMGRQQCPPVDVHEVESLVNEYAAATSGLVDLFQRHELQHEMKTWARNLTSRADDPGAAVFYLVLAIGVQERQEAKAEAWFRHARDVLLKYMSNSMNVSTVQGFALVAVFMLRAFQPNGAFLYFSLAARAAYAIGLHRTEVNASFGDTVKIVRDRIWKSLRVVDELISNVLGRPTSTSDVDCTVKYSVSEIQTDIRANILDASVQIFMIVERVVVEVYSRKRISLRIADYVSRQLKSWASNWLQTLSNVINQPNQIDRSREAIIGACSTLCSYYYGIMLLTRPFLIYDLYEYMGASIRSGGTQGDLQNKRKYADAALDAAAALVDTLQPLIKSGDMPRRMPLIVSWLFTAALVLSVGIIGSSSLSLEENCKDSIRALDYFGEVDPHARQYSIIVHSLLKTTAAHVKKREHQLRLQRKQASSDLFGLLPSDTPNRPHTQHNGHSQCVPEALVSQSAGQANIPIPAPHDWTIYDADFFALPWSNENDQGLQDFLQPGTHTLNGSSVADIPLFPIYDQQSGSGVF